MAKEKFPFYRQLDYRDCGPTCLRMIAKFHGKIFSREFLRDKAGITRTGVNMAGIECQRLSRTYLSFKKGRLSLIK